jgi:hypothetical protein
LALNTPDTTVLIDGTEYSNSTIDQVIIGFGRSVVWEQARASYAQISLYNPSNTNWTFDLNSTVVIKTKNATGTDRTLFTGKINSFKGRVLATGEVAEVGLVEIIALGEFARMSRILVGEAGYAREYDDVRMTNIFTEAGVSVDTVDTPGVYEFDAYSGGINNALTLASKYADMAFGYIYETTTGTVGYANESRRTVAVAASGYDDIPTNYIQAYSVASEKTSADVINDVYLTYGSNANKTATNATSITSYGLIAANIQTELHNATEAQYQANRYIALKASPETNLSAFNIELLNPNISNADVDIFLQLYMGKAISITGLSNSIIHTTYEGFVEGWSWNISRTNISLSINSTSSIYSLTPTRWQDVDAALIWSAVNPTLQWAQYN